MVDPSKRTRPPAYPFKFQSCQTATGRRTTSRSPQTRANHLPNTSGIVAKPKAEAPDPLTSRASTPPVNRYLGNDQSTRKREMTQNGRKTCVGCLLRREVAARNFGADAGARGDMNLRHPPRAAPPQDPNCGTCGTARFEPFRTVAVDSAPEPNPGPAPRVHRLPVRCCHAPEQALPPRPEHTGLQRCGPRPGDADAVGEAVETLPPLKCGRTARCAG